MAKSSQPRAEVDASRIIGGQAPPRVVANVAKDMRRKQLPELQQARVQIEELKHKAAQKIVDKSVTGAVRAGVAKPKGKRAQSRLLRWLELLEKPFLRPVVRCPVNYNPTPTFVTSLATTTSSGNQQVLSNTQASFYIYPGHGTIDPADPMDGPSYHALRQNVNGTNYVIGPMGNGTDSAIGMIYVTGESSTTEGQVTSTSGATTFNVNWDRQLPFTAASGDGGHTRWKLISLGFKIWNITPMSNRGGTLVTVQPPNKVAFSTGKEYAIFPSYDRREFGDEKVHEISWTPRMEDLSFWHSTSATASTSNAIPGIRVSVVNSTSQTQNIGYELICHWEIGGSNLASIGSETVHLPNDKQIVESTVDVMANSKPSSSGAIGIAKMVVNSVAETARSLNEHPTVMSSIGSLAKTALGVVESFL